MLGMRKHCSSTGMDRKHTLCVSTARYTSPPEARERVLRLRSHPITSDPCRSSHNAPLTKHTHTHTHTHTYTRLRQFISMQISARPSSGRRAWQTAFSPLYHMEDLDCIVSSWAEPSSHEYIQHIACLNWFIEFYVKYPSSSFYAGFLHLHFVHAGRGNHAHSEWCVFTLS